MHGWGGMHGEEGMNGRGMCIAGGHVCVGGALCVVGACIAGETATAGDGTHPTGMDSCLSGEYIGYFQKLASRIEPMKMDLEVRMVYGIVRKELHANYSITSELYIFAG